jgi:hypothetical protein
VHRVGLLRRQSTALALGLAALLPLAACSGDGRQASSTDTAKRAATGDRLDLRDVCPKTVVVQSSWFPQVEHGSIYQLLGSSYKVDVEKKTVTGPLVSGGTDTGVRLEIRAGGPAIGFEQTSARLYLDKTITLAMLNTDEAAQLSAKQPTLAVVAPMDLDPQIILWDPKSHPDFNTIMDIGQTDTKVLYFQGSTYMEYLIGSGILRRSQVDSSYDGSPSRFISSSGTIAAQAYATNEPYLYQHEIRAWGKPVSFQLVNETGYPNYANVIAIRAGEKDQLGPCLRKLVPIIQQGQVDFMAKPEAATDLILKLSESYKTGFVYSPGLANYGVDEMRSLGIISNGENKTLGDFNDSRLRRLIEIVTPIFDAQHKPIKDGLQPIDIATNEFLDPGIGLPAAK